MSYLLEILGRGLLAELAGAFRDLLRDDGRFSTQELQDRRNRRPDSVECPRRLAIRMLADRQFGRARSAFLEALALDKADRVSIIGLACTLDELGLTRAAAEQLQAALKSHPDDGPTLFAHGFCQEKLGDTQDAIASYESTLDVAPQLRNAHERLAAIYLKLDNTDMAITHYEHLCWCDPDDIAASLTLANLYVRAGRHEDAIQRYQFALTLDPDNWEAQDDLVTACTDAGQYHDAIETLQDLVERRPECADQHLRLGDLYGTIGQEEQALASYIEAVRLNPDCLEANIKLGTARLRRGRFIEAAGSFNQAIEINDRIVTAYVGMGVAQQALGQTENALASLEMASDIEPSSTLLFSEIARLQLKVMAAQQAQRYLSPQAIAAAPHGPPQPPAADLIETQMDNLQVAIREHPGHADLHYRHGLLLRHTGDLRGAISAFRKAVSINPNYLKALTKLGLALREAGELDEAIVVLQRALHVDPESIDLHYQLGLIFADQTQFAMALERFEHAAEAEPQNIDYVANLALSLQDMGLLDRAHATWKTLCDVARDSPQGRYLLSHADRASQSGA